MGKKRRKNLKDIQNELTDDYITVMGKYGLYRRRKVKVRDRKSKPQIKVRNSFAELAPIWTDLPVKDKYFWDKYARDRDCRSFYSKAKTMTGQIFFITVNRNQQECGAPIIKTIPSPEHPQTFRRIEINIINDEKTQDIIMIIEPEILEHTKLTISATMPMSENRFYVNPNEYKKIHVIGSEFKSGDSIKEAYINKFTNIPGVGEKAEFLLKSYNKKCGTVNTLLKVISPVNTTKWDI